MQPSRRLIAAMLCAATVVASLSDARAFIFDEGSGIGRWSGTASGSAGSPGDPVTLTWSIVPDGTVVETSNNGTPTATSNLVSKLDSLFGSGPFGATIAEKPWFHFFEESFARYSELSGLTYAYEPNDDAVRIGNRLGLRGTRGDVRISGISIDGSGDVLGYNGFPNDGDMVLDTAETTFISNSSSDHVRFRNLIMHEHGHGLGLQHVDSSTDALLMETFIQTSFSGPQLDEIRGLHFFYGDVNEKSNEGQGNDAAALATNLGSITLGATAAVGSDADVGKQRIADDATDFVSIDHDTDVDFYAFEVDGPATLDAILTPRGGVFTQSSVGFQPTSFNANARVDLALEIIDADGATMLALANDEALGGVESVVDLQLSEAGQYFARVYGLNDTIQLYELELFVTAPADFLEADFNEDGEVDGGDLTVWQDGFGLDAAADADDDLDSDGADFLTWQRQFGQPLPLESSVAASAVPEPSALAIALVIVTTAAIASQRRNLK